LVETHAELDTTTIKVNNQVVIIQVQVGKYNVEDVLKDGGASVNVIIKNLETKVGLPKPKPTPYHLKMANQSMIRPLGFIKNLKIHIHYIPYINTFIIMKNSVVDSNYFMLLRRPWFRDATITCDWGNSVIAIQGNGIVMTISVNGKVGVESKRLQILVCYDLMEGVIDKKGRYDL
jgi:hypothetical protein